MAALPWNEVYWDIPLGSAPEVAKIAKNVHGADPVDLYCLPNLWSLHLYSYQGLLKVKGHDLPIRPGYVGVTPPGAVTEFHYLGLSAHLYVHFWFREGGATPMRRIRAMQDLGERFDPLYSRLEKVIGGSDLEAGRVSARLWDTLWDLSDTEGGESSIRPQPPIVRRVAAEIERRLTEPITVAELAAGAQVSTGYLVRLFREAHGQTVVGYIRQRRVERAVHLLQRSTLPVKVIASSVGIPDLQHFNKVIRQDTGLSPRALRMRVEV